MHIIETRFLIWWRRHRHLTAGPAWRAFVAEGGRASLRSNAGDPP